ncbi:equilibrative nucleoside transporter 1 isoform X1 [Cimex lectularius]|uniref:Equilibrative nucleoside transporter n=2 Tax=Cimex lectularius TaxID=79782 RepID=A0A8I6RAF8_CIMLE|nr:equilibrative nucleoside transporter 1 isoform X1 [Cimex lectularius]
MKWMNTPSNKRGHNVMPEEQLLLTDHSKANIINTSANGKIGEKQAFLAPEPVRLTPAWEETNLTNDELNFKGVTMEQAQLETNPPKDRFNIVYLILLLHGIGTLLPWNMYINAKNYFVEYKLSYEYTGENTTYAGNFLPYVGIAAQGPNLIVNWLNVFIQIGGKLTTRIVWSIVVEVIAFIVTVVFAMIDTSSWVGIFFWSTMGIVVVLNMANGIYQNTFYGLAAKLPPKYTGVIVLGSNVSGTLSSVMSIISIAIAPNAKTAAMYYFICALFILSLCFDTYFALPLNRFYKYHELMSQKEIQKRLKDNSNKTESIPYWKIFKQAYPQCLNVFLVFFLTLALFPTVDSDVKKSDPDFIIPDKYYVDVMCFLTFNFSAMVGSFLPRFGCWPGPKRLWIPVVLRYMLIPLFLLCNYRPLGVERSIPVVINNDWAYLSLGIILGISNGYFSAVAMMYCPGSVGAEHSYVASMFGAASLITGIASGIVASMVFPWIVSNITIPSF